jgi:flagellar basal-body rod modification protein FlgD
MTDVSGVNSTTQQTSTGASTGTSAQIGEEFNSFIKLLTAQVQNQDPLSPLDSTQFVEQLATFSSLEQQVQSNSHLENIGGMINGLYSTVLAGQWLGQTVTVDSSWVPFSGDAVEYVINLPDTIDNAVVKVKDSNGNEVWRETLDPTDDRYFWYGQQNGSTELADSGIYEMNIEMYKDGELVANASPLLVTSVTDVSTEDGIMTFGTALNLTADLTTIRKYKG